MLNSLHKNNSRHTRLNILAYLAFVFIGVGMAVAIGYLVVTGNWMIGAGLLLALPIFVLLHKYPWLALLIWLAVLPFFTVTPTASGRWVFWAIHRALPPATVIIILVASILRINRRAMPRPGWPELAMLGYIFMSILSIYLLNVTPLATFYIFYDRVIIPMSLYLIIRLWSPTEEDFNRLAPVVLLLVVTQIIVGLLAWYTPQFVPSKWLTEDLRTVGTLKSYGTYAVAMIFSGLLLLQTAVHRDKGSVRNLYTATFLLAVFGVFITFSRGAWLAGVLVLAGVLYFYFRHVIRISLIVIPLIILLAGGLLAGQLDWARERLYSDEAEESALVRLPAYQASLRMLAAKPALGWGYENFNRYDWQFYSAVEGTAAPIRDISSHNFYLNMLAEQGLLGTLMFLFPAFWWFVRSIKVMPLLPSDGFWSKRLLIIFWMFILAYVVINLFHNIRVPFGLGLWWITLGLIASIVEGSQRLSASRTVSRSTP